MKKNLTLIIVMLFVLLIILLSVFLIIKSNSSKETDNITNLENVQTNSFVDTITNNLSINNVIENTSAEEIEEIKEVVSTDKKEDKKIASSKQTSSKKETSSKTNNTSKTNTSVNTVKNNTTAKKDTLQNSSSTNKNTNSNTNIEKPQSITNNTNVSEETKPVTNTNEKVPVIEETKKDTTTKTNDTSSSEIPKTEEPKEENKRVVTLKRNETYINKLIKYITDKGYIATEDASIVELTNPFTYSSFNIDGYLGGPKNLKVYARDYYVNGVYQWTQCFII